MALRIVTADERLAEANLKTTAVILGPSGVGKTTLLKTLPEATTLCLDLEAGLKSVQDWRGDSLPLRTFEDALDIACLIGGINPAAEENAFFSEAHYRHLAAAHPDLVEPIAGKGSSSSTRQAMAWAKTRPEAFSEKTGNPDTRGAYGLPAREVIGLPPPSSAAISRMEEAITWNRFLERKDAHLMWARAEGAPWKELCYRRLIGGGSMRSASSSGG